MYTAREKLYQDILALFTKPFTEFGQQEVMGILSKYRIQIKADGIIPSSITARQQLGRNLVQLWQDHNISAAEVKSAINAYRMQFKKSENKQQNNRKHWQIDIKEKILIRKSKQIVEDAIIKCILSNRYTEKSKIQPIAGGPIKRNKSRANCPKCHSYGVVLARSYSGDEYFNCIYCGFQAYRSSANAELDLPLASELLNRTIREKTANE